MSLKKIVYKTLLNLRKPGVVLYGHNATQNKNDQILPSLHLYPNELERSINSFLELGIEFISMDTLIKISKNKFKHDKPWVHFSFDDGYKENLQTVLPLFEKYNLPFTVFISSNHIANHERFYSFRARLAVMNAKTDIEILGEKIASNLSTEERSMLYKKIWPKIKELPRFELLELFKTIDSILPAEEKEYLYNYYFSDEILTPEELISLSNNPLVHIGSHCHNHVVLNKNVNLEDIDFELRTSQRWLTERLGVEVPVFCYPNGTKFDYTKDSISASKKYYKLAFTTIHGFVDKRTNPYLIPRCFLLTDVRSIINRLVFPDIVIKLKTALFKV